MVIGGDNPPQSCYEAIYIFFIQSNREDVSRHIYSSIIVRNEKINLNNTLNKKRVKVKNLNAIQVE